MTLSHCFCFKNVPHTRALGKENPGQKDMLHPSNQSYTYTGCPELVRREYKSKEKKALLLVDT